MASPSTKALTAESEKINPLREYIAHVLQLTHYILDANTTLSDITVIKDKAKAIEKMSDGMYKVFKL